MSWKGRILGAIVGLFLPVPFSSVIGFILGWYFVDKPENDRLRAGGYARARFSKGPDYNESIIMGTFALLGYVARGAGAIQPEQIRLAENCMSNMYLDAASRHAAISAFNRGKSDDFNLFAETSAIRQSISGNVTLISYLFEVLVQIALTDFEVTREERTRLHNVGQQFGIRPEEIDRLIEIRLSEMNFRRGFSGRYSGQQGGFGPDYSSGSADSGNSGYQDSGNSGYQGAGSGSYGSSDKLDEAYRIIGVSPETPWKDVRTAYKRLMNKYHPDRLMI